MNNAIKKYIIFFGLSSCTFLSFGQVGIGIETPSSKAMLEVASSSDGGAYKGFMPPCVPDDAAKIEISPTANDEGLMVYVKKTGSLEIWNGTAWESSHLINSSGHAKDLFISEYVEKSSGNNKAIEIANFTGKPVNLNDYELLVNSNGGIPANDTSSEGAGGINVTTVTLGTSTLASGQVLVIRTDNASQISIGTAGPRTFFDGNDAIILRKTGKGQPWIDVIGLPRVNWEFGKAVTLRKKPGYGPSRFYVPAQFEVYPEGTYDGLGSHTF